MFRLTLAAQPEMNWFLTVILINIAGAILYVIIPLLVIFVNLTLIHPHLQPLRYFMMHLRVINVIVLLELYFRFFLISFLVFLYLFCCLSL